MPEPASLMRGTPDRFLVVVVLVLGLGLGSVGADILDPLPAPSSTIAASMRPQATSAPHMAALEVSMDASPDGRSTGRTVMPRVSRQSLSDRSAPGDDLRIYLVRMATLQRRHSAEGISPYQPARTPADAVVGTISPIYYKDPGDCSLQQQCGIPYLPSSDTWLEGALEGLVGPVWPLETLGKSWPKWADSRRRHGSIVEASL
jgi:hypothetical protein